MLTSGLTSYLAKSALGRLPDAWAPSTYRSYNTMFRLYLAFIVFMQVYHLSAVKSYYVRLALPVAVFDSQQITMYLKSLQKTAPFSVRLSNLIDVTLLKALIAKCEMTYMGDIFKAVYLLAFFGFLRLSNLVPHSLNSYSHLRQLSKGDFFFTPTEGIVLLK